MEINKEEGLARTGRVVVTSARIIRVIALILGIICIAMGIWVMGAIGLDDQGNKLVRMLDKADPLVFGVVLIVVTLVATYIIKGFAQPKQTGIQRR